MCLAVPSVALSQETKLKEQNRRIRRCWGFVGIDVAGHVSESGKSVRFNVSIHNPIPESRLTLRRSALLPGRLPQSALPVDRQ